MSLNVNATKTTTMATHFNTQLAWLLPMQRINFQARESVSTATLQQAEASYTPKTITTLRARASVRTKADLRAEDSNLCTRPPLKSNRTSQHQPMLTQAFQFRKDRAGKWWTAPQLFSQKQNSKRSSTWNPKSKQVKPCEQSLQISVIKSQGAQRWLKTSSADKSKNKRVLRLQDLTSTTEGTCSRQTQGSLTTMWAQLPSAKILNSSLRMTSSNIRDQNQVISKWKWSIRKMQLRPLNKLTKFLKWPTKYRTALTRMSKTLIMSSKVSKICRLSSLKIIFQMTWR